MVIHSTLGQTTGQMGQNTVSFLIAAHFQYLLITVNVVALEKVSFSDKENPKAVCYHIHSQWEALSAY